MRIHTEPETEWKNIFQLWRDAGERVPFRVVRNSWSATRSHVLIVERVELDKWPYGKAWGTFYYEGSPPEGGRIGVAGTYAWRLQRPGDIGYKAE
jgi:hypothetical protein